MSFLCLVSPCQGPCSPRMSLLFSLDRRGEGKGKEMCRSDCFSQVSANPPYFCLPLSFTITSRSTWNSNSPSSQGFCFINCIWLAAFLTTSLCSVQGSAKLFSILFLFMFPNILLPFQFNFSLKQNESCFYREQRF